LLSVSGRRYNGPQEDSMHLNSIDRVAFVTAGVLAVLIVAGLLLT
jgi:hypothetical protein